MKKILGCLAALALVIVGAACSSNEFNLTVGAIQGGADYVLTVEKAPASSFQMVSQDATTVETLYAGFQKGTTTAQDVQNAITDLQAHLTAVFQALHIVNPQSQALGTLTISEAGSLLSYITTIQTGQSVQLVASPSKTFKAAFNNTAGTKILK